MTPYYHDDWLTIYQGDVRTVLPELAADSVDCIVTSPPYWGLRDYGTANWTGGSEACDHLRAPGGTGGNPKYGPNKGNANGAPTPMGQVCGKCGAVRADAQLGLERTPEEYVASMVAIFRELRRVLKPSGTCWLNLGDSYAANRSYQVTDTKWTDVGNTKGSDVPPGLKPKDLVGIPWRVAFALQADGWYLRSDIIWSKPNPMPESVTDRPTKAHEYMFLLTKSARYYFDADAVREPHQGGYTTEAEYLKRTNRSAHYENGNSDPKGGGFRGEGALGRDKVKWNPAGRNLRSVWTIATRPYPGAHFAVFPPELPERCIKAGSSERGVCPQCGKPWNRIMNRAQPPFVEPSDLDRYGNGEAGVHRKIGGEYQKWLEENPPETLGWMPTCRHFDGANPGDPVPAVVLDPFAGSGTTGMVANRLSRRAILIDLNGDYLKQQLKRNAQTPLGLAG